MHEGNRPSTLLLFRELNPAALGALVALYEHKVFTQSVCWGINAFDQWGVELGKKMATAIAPLVSGEGEAASAFAARHAAHAARVEGASLSIGDYPGGEQIAPWLRYIAADEPPLQLHRGREPARRRRFLPSSLPRAYSCRLAIRVCATMCRCWWMRV